MKKFVLLVQVVCLFPIVCSSQKIANNFSANTNNSVGNDWLNVATQQLDEASYHFKNIENKFVVLNKKQQIAFSISNEKVVVKPIQKNTGE